MRLVQHVMLPDSNQTHLAEVILSGMIKRKSPQDDYIPPNEIQYDFYSGIRKLLLSTNLISETIEILSQVSEFIGNEIGKPLDFRTLIADPTKIDEFLINEESLPLAEIAITVLKYLGGEYTQLAIELEKRMSPSIVINDRIKVGIIGVGRKGTLFVEKIRSNNNVELVGIADNNPTISKAVGYIYNTDMYNNYKDLIKKVDAIILALPLKHDFSIARDILLNNVHLLYDRPVCYDLESVDELLNITEERKLILHVGLVERFNPAIVHMSSLINNPIFIESKRLDSKGNNRDTDTDVIMDLMIHDLDIILNIIPSELKEIHPTIVSIINGEINIANARLHFDNGSIVDLVAGRFYTKILRTMRVYQPDAFLQVNLYRKEISIINLEKKYKDINSALNKIAVKNMRFEYSDPLSDLTHFFIKSIQDGKSRYIKPDMTARYALKVALYILDSLTRQKRDLGI